MSSRKQIGNTLTITTMDDPVSVQAQYSPDKVTVHTTWQNGDLYMRTRESDDAAWSSWHRIVGESGDETDFRFAISSQKTTASASTSPSDIGANDWADAPVAITSAKPYLWARVQQKSWNASTQDYVVDSTRYIRLTGENGVSITSADVVFGLSTSETTAPSPDNTTTWKTSIAALSLTSSDKNKYIWQCTKITYSNENTVYTGKMCLGIVSSFADIVEQYTIGTASAATGTWQDTTPPAMANGYYLWTRTKLVYSDNSVSYAPSSNGYCVGYYGVDGTSITGANVWYALSTSNSSAPQDSAFTLDDFPTTLNAGYYVWEATKITFSSGSPIFTGKMCLGATSDFLSGTEVYAISTSNSTAPADNQFGTTYSKTNGYYLWTATRVQYTNGNYAYLNKKCVGYWGEDGTDGTSPYFADLDNEMDAIQCKHDGGVIADQTVSTVISMWKGSAVEAFVIDNIYRNGTQLTWDGNNNGVWPRSSGSTVSLEFTTSASIANIDDFKITIHSYNDNTVTRELHFTINGVRANAIYRLVPSHSQIIKKKDGTYVPSGNVTCSVEKTENGSTSTPDASEYTLEKSVNGGSYTTYSATAASSITSDLKFRLTVGGVVVDLETIPLVSDGNKGDTGDSAPAAFASPAQISIPCYSNGNVKAQKTTSVSFNLKVGAENATVTGITSGYTPTGVSVQVVYANAATITVRTSATASGLSAGVTFTVTGTYDGKTYSATVTVALIGSTQGEQGDPGSPGGTGPRGKIGRFYYYAQEWSNDPSVSYAVTDAEAPFFFYKNPTTGAENYWVFNPAENGTYTMQDMGEPSNTENWKMMETAFKFIITEAIFGNYAHLGSAIINGDYLISQYGYMLGFCNTRTPINDKTQYQNVDTDDILGEDNMYDPQKLIWDDSEVRTITSTEYTHISSASFVQNRYYAFEIDEETELSGNELLWTIVSQSGTVIANGTITSTATGMKRNCVIFKSTISTTCNLRVKIVNKNEIVVISHIYLRFAKFIPYLAMDLLAGKIVANNIIARGELHADSLYHTMVYGNSNDDRFTINDESIINLSTRAVGTKVILPSPTLCKGRVIELFNHSEFFYATWVGAGDTSAFKGAYGAGLDERVVDQKPYNYIKFYCDGTDWWILKAEG